MNPKEEKRYLPVTASLFIVLLVFLLWRVCVEPGNWATYNLSDYLILFTTWEK